MSPLGILTIWTKPRKMEKRKMIKSNASRAGAPWTNREHARLVSSYDSGKTYGEIANLKMFAGKRTKKAIRRRFERIVLDC